MTKFLDLGITLTIFLISVSTMYTFVNEFDNTGITPDTTYGSESITNKVESLQISVDVNASDQTIKTGVFSIPIIGDVIAAASQAVSSGIGFIENVISGLFVFGQLLFSMFTGWAAILDALFIPYGLDGLALVIKTVLGGIEFVTLFWLSKDIIIGLAARFS